MERLEQLADQAQPGKPVRNAHIESFNSRLRDACRLQHWFASLSHMRNIVYNWRDGYTHEPATQRP